MTSIADRESLQSVLNKINGLFDDTATTENRLTVVETTVADNNTLVAALETRTDALEAFDATLGTPSYTVADFVALDALTDSDVAVGDFVRVTSIGAAYQAVASGEHFTTAGGLKVLVLPGAGGVDVRAFGAVGDGVTDDTAAIQAAIDAVDCIQIPSGTYLCDAINLSSGKTVLTDGFSTRLKQTASPGTDVRLVNVVGSNVTIGPAISVEGQIDVQSGEQYHGVYIRATASTGALNNIRIGDVFGENIRGDIIYVGAFAGYPLDDVSVGNISGTNIYRNGVSHTGGNLKCGDVFVDRIGYATVDVEPEPTYEPCYQSHFGNVKGGIVGSVAASASKPNYDVQFASIDLNPDYVTAPSQPYAPAASVQDGLLLRNTKSIRVGYLRSTNHDRCEVFVSFGAGELGVENMNVGHMHLIGVAGKNDDPTYPAMLQAQSLFRMTVGTLEVSFSGDRVFNYAPHLTIGNVKADLGADSRLVRSGGYVDIANIEVTGTGIVFQSITGGSVRNGTIACNRLASSCGKMTFEGITATAAVFLFDAANDNHVIINSTLNTDFYSIGQFVSDYTVPFRIGAYRLWVDTTGDLRIKNSAPTSDTDGTVVGTQT